VRETQEGAPITYVSRQLGKDASNTCACTRTGLPGASRDRLVDALDDAAPYARQAPPRVAGADQELPLSRFDSVVNLDFASWNQIGKWLRRVEALRDAA
jgi:hypothetical protein